MKEVKKVKKERTSKVLNAPSSRMAKMALKTKIEKDSSAKYGVENCCVKQYWAVVERDGTLIRGRNVLRTRRLGTGMYEVFFTGDVTQGVFNATIGRPGIATEPSGEIGVALRCCPSLYMPFENNKGVWVDTHDSDGRLSDRAFHLMVHTH